MGRVGRGAVAVGVLVVAACGGGAGDGGGDGEAGGGAPVRASIQESTLFATQRAFGLTLAPATDRDVRVGAIQLSSPLFAEVEPQPRDALVRATDRAVVMPLRYGEAVCDGGDGEGGAELVTDVDGEAVRVPLGQSPADLLAGIHAAECASAGVLEDVELRLGDEWVPTAPQAVAGTLEASQRHEGVDATLQPLEGNVIFGVTTDAAEGEAWLAVSDEAPAAIGAVEVRAARCDPHALIEYKRTFVFTIRVAVGDAEPVLVDVEAEGPAHAALEALLASCLE
jgi:hypothetical protein